MLRRPIFKEVRSRKQTLQDTTIRDFSGGWNVIDNDLNLDPRFAKVLTNLYRRPDGSLGLRYGTELFGDIAEASYQRGVLSDDGTTFATSYTGDITAATVDTTAVVTITLTETDAEHDLVVGQVVNIAAGFSVGGLSAGDWNGDRTVTGIPSSSSFTIVADSNATSTTTSAATEETITQKATDIAGANDVIVGTEYFQDHIIAVTDQGEVWSIDSLGAHARIWSTAIAAAQAGSPTGWSTGLSFASFAVKNSILTIHNGIDKPLEVDLDIANGVKCQYVVDAASGSNTNTPIGRYAVAADRYLVIAGDPTEPDAIHISNIDTYGTFVGDANPNDAIKIRMSQRVPTKSPSIRGIGWFRDQLIIGFDDGVAFMQLGTYDDSSPPVHEPTVIDFIENIGCHAHGSMKSIGDDFFMSDHIGVPSVQRALFTGGIRAERVSQLIDPEIQSAIAVMTVGQIEDGVFALFNPNDNQYMLFVPNAAETARDVFVYTVIRTLKVAAWSKFEGWNFRCGCTSLLGRVFLATGTRLFLYGDQQNEIYADFINDPDIDEPDVGEEIDFEWELPWADFDRRANTKMMEYLKLETTGNATFRLRMYVDNLLNDPDGGDGPALNKEFTAGTTIGYGSGGFGSIPYGGGAGNDERLWKWPAKGNIFKMIFSGSTRVNIRFISFTLLYRTGSIRR